MTSILKMLIAILLVSAGAAVHAQSFPAKPVRMVIHIGPGSSMDIIGRVLAQKLNEAWGQPVIVDNRGGAGGTIGMDVVAKAPPDGDTARAVWRSLPRTNDMDKWRKVVKAAGVSAD